MRTIVKIAIVLCVALLLALASWWTRKPQKVSSISPSSSIMDDVDTEVEQQAAPPQEQISVDDVPMFTPLAKLIAGRMAKT